jgi:putative colanic acid biosynthesis UDP-glucose lipid carrier transferase|tara:strand:- start:81 stop:1496 length:1416 start_codon:yes stop_codon:yes gene_type:complete
MEDNLSRMVRSKDAKINAFSRLIDAGIIGSTLVALVSVLKLEWLPSYSWLLLSAIVLFSFLTESSRSYKSWRDISISDEIMAVGSNWLVVVIIFVAIQATVQPVDLYNREMVLYWFILTPIELISWHSIMRMALRFFRYTGVSAQTVAIYGATELGSGLETRIQSMPWAGYNFVGFFDDRKTNGTRRFISDQSLIKGGSQDLIDQARAGTIDTIFITLPLAAENRIKSLLDELSDTTVSAYMMLDLFSFDLLNASWLDVQGMPAVSIFESPHTGLDNITKRCLDLVFSTLILGLIAVPMLAIALSIKLTSKGPVIFRQLRYGIGGESIHVWKFRTMTSTDAGDGEVKQACRSDSRITKLGRFLRKTSLDELPQFFNVMAGTMSIVGPRPHAVTHNEFYRSAIHGYMLRHKVKPGITGLAQVKGYRGATDTLEKMEGRIKYDLEYIRSWSLWLDIKLIVMTVFVGFTNKNAF